MAMIPAIDISIVFSSDGDALDNLMNSLAAELVLVGDLSQAQAIAAKLRNFIITIILRRGPWLQRTPLPTWNLIQGLDPIKRNLIFLISLTNITNPGSERNFFSFANFYMDGRHAAMTLARRELIECFYVNFKSCLVVHSWDNNSAF